MSKKEDSISLEEIIGYQFKDPSLLEEALTHPSCRNSEPDISSYERMEFLGDAVLELLATHMIYIKNPLAAEGDLTKRRASLVSGETLCIIASSVGLGDYVRMSPQQIKSGGRKRSRTLEDSLEALFGAAFLDGGITAAQEVFNKLFVSHGFEVLEGDQSRFNPKGTLQEKLQSEVPPSSPTYEIVSEGGPDHRKKFRAVVKNGDTILGEGEGFSKKEATSNAAQSALDQWDSPLR